MGICQTKKQQRLIISRLKAFAKSMNLVGLTGGPQKPEALVRYEAQKAKQSRAAESGPGAPKAPLSATPARTSAPQTSGSYAYSSINPAKAPQQIIPPGPALQLASPSPARQLTSPSPALQLASSSEAKGSPPTTTLMETPATSPPPKATDRFANCH